jgi:hypothetical protein
VWRRIRTTDDGDGQRTTATDDDDGRRRRTTDDGDRRRTTDDDGDGRRTTDDARRTTDNGNSGGYARRTRTTGADDARGRWAEWREALSNTSILSAGSPPQSL